MPSTDSNSLCLECGLCCNGVIFADVQLEPEDDVARLKSLGLPLARAGSKGSKASKGSPLKFPQPCAAFDGCRCRIYSDRPKYCREFECLLLKQVKAGRLEKRAALQVIAAARRKVDEVEQLLQELGDTDERAALSQRFRRLQQQLEANLPAGPTAEVFGRLTLAMQDLNVLLSEDFYPGP